MATNFIQLAIKKVKDTATNLGYSVNQGMTRVANTPWQQFTPLSMKSMAVPAAQTLGTAFGKPQLGQDIGYGLRGALSVTPFQSYGKLTPQLSQTQARSNPTNFRQQAAQSIGQGVYGSMLTAPIAGGPLGVAKNAVLGTGLGVGMGVGADLITGKGLPNKQRLAEQALSGFQSSWTLPITNAITDKIMSKIAPTLVGGNLTEPFRNGQVKEGFARLFTRALAEVPAENTAFTWLGRMDSDSKNTFMQDWMNNLPGNILTNLAYAGGQGTFNTVMNKESRQAVNEALQNTLRKWNTPVTTMKLDKNGRRIKMPMWKYEFSKNQPGMTTKDVNELSVEDYQKATGKSVTESNLYDTTPLEKSATKTYGTTKKLADYQGSFILKDGKLLDLDDAGHRELGINDFGRETGGLRLRVTPDEVNIDFINSKTPTPLQISKIEDLAKGKRLVYEIVDDADNAIKGFGGVGKSIETMKADVSRFYKNVAQQTVGDISKLAEADQKMLKLSLQDVMSPDTRVANGASANLKYLEGKYSLKPQDLVQMGQQELNAPINYPKAGKYPEIKSGVPNMSILDNDKGLEPLYAQARKFNTPEEFFNWFYKNETELAGGSIGVKIDNKPFDWGKATGKSSLDLKDIYNQSKQTLSVPPTQAKGVEGVNPKGNLKTQPVPGSQTGKILSTVQSVSESPIRTTASSEVSSARSITEKGKLNIENLNVGGEAKKVLKTQEAQVKPTVIGNKEVVDMARTAKGTKTLTDEAMTKLMAQQLKNRQKVVDLSKQFNEAKASGADEVALGKIALQIADESQTARQSGTFAGRLLQAQNILADESASPMQKIFALLDNAGANKKSYIRDSVKINWDNPGEVVSFYRKYVPPKMGEILDEIRYSNMLSSPLTHIINITSNAVQTGVVAPVEKTITGTLDFGKHLLTGSERQYYASSGIDYAGGYVKALPQAFKKAFKVLSGEDVLVKPDLERIPLGTKGFLKAYSTPLRALESMDQFFKTLVEGGVTAELKNAPTKLTATQISDSATKEANYRLFRQAFDPDGKLGQGGLLKLFDKWNSVVAQARRLPGGKWILPFLQTPTNILKQGIEYSPLGVSTMPGSKAPIEQLSKAIIGTGVVLGAYQLAKNGLTTWDAPTGETERNLYYAAGMQPYSVKIGDKWVSYSKLGPLSYPIAMAAALASAEKNNPDKSQLENIGKSISGILGFFGDQSYVRSIGDLVDAIQGGVNIGTNALSAEGANLAGQLVPYKSFLTWLGRTIDPTYRKASTFGERMIKDLPILGDNLKPYTDMNGDPSKRDFPLLNAVSPYRVTQEKQPEATLLNQYQSKKIENAAEKRKDEEFLKSDGAAQQTGEFYRYIDDNGSVKKIQMDWKPSELMLTGDTVTDKILLSNWKGTITARQKEMTKLFDLTVIDQGTFIKAMNDLDKLKKSYEVGGSKKFAVKKVPSAKITKVKSPRIPRLKTSIKSVKLKTKKYKFKKTL